LFSHLDLLDHRWLFFVGAVLQDNPYLYLASQTPNAYYTYSAYTTTGQRLITTAFFSHADKFFSDMHSKISPNLNLSRVYTSSIMDGQPSTNTITQLKMGTDLTAAIRSVDIAGGFSYSLSGEKNTSGNKEETQTHEMDIHLDLTWKIATGVFFSGNTAWSRVIPPGVQPINTIASAAGIDFRPGEGKWEYGVQCTNVFNQRAFSYSAITPLQTSLQQYRLFPRCLSARLRYTF